jgi:hypothetical protein
MKVSETSQKIYDGISSILKENGQALTKAQAYAIESLVETVEESTEKRCCEVTEQILAKKDKLVGVANNEVVSEATVAKVNEMVEARIEQLKKDMPQILDYAKLKKLEQCVESVKECVGYKADEQVEKVAAESAKMLKSTKTLIETQAKAISEKAATLSESAKEIGKLKEQVKQMQVALESKEKQIVESTKKNAELVSSVNALQKKVEESKKITESIEEKRKQESLKFYLEEKIASYPKYEAALLRKHFQNARSRAEIDENFQKALTMVGEKRDAMRTVQAIPVAKVNEVTNKTISGETIVKENGGQNEDNLSSMLDDPFVEVDFSNDAISPEEMATYMTGL